MVIDCRFVTHILLALFNNHRLYYRLHSWLKEVPLTAEWRTEFFKSHALHFIGRSECGQVKAAGKSRKINQVIYHYQYAAEHRTARPSARRGNQWNWNIFGKDDGAYGLLFSFHEQLLRGDYPIRVDAQDPKRIRQANHRDSEINYNLV